MIDSGYPVPDARSERCENEHDARTREEPECSAENIGDWVGEDTGDVNLCLIEARVGDGKVRGVG